MQRDLRVVHESLEKLVHQVDVERTDSRPREIDVELETWPAREIDDDPRQRFIERYVSVAVTAYALLVSDRVRKSLAERDPDIFHRVVRVDVQIAARLYFQIEQPVACDLIEHVIEEGDLRFDARAAGSIQVQLYRDLRLERIACDLGTTRVG